MWEEKKRVWTEKEGRDDTRKGERRREFSTASHYSMEHCSTYLHSSTDIWHSKI